MTGQAFRVPLRDDPVPAQSRRNNWLEKVGLSPMKLPWWEKVLEYFPGFGIIPSGICWYRRSRKVIALDLQLYHPGPDSRRGSDRADSGFVLSPPPLDEQSQAFLEDPRTLADEEAADGAQILDPVLVEQRNLMEAKKANSRALCLINSLFSPLIGGISLYVLYKVHQI